MIEFLETKVISELGRVDSAVEHKTMAMASQTFTIFIKLLRGLYVNLILRLLRAVLSPFLSLILEL